MLQKDKRRLLFYNYQDMSLEFMDLRKARCLVLKESDDSIKNLHVESGPMLMVDCPPYAMYFVMSSPRETKVSIYLSVDEIITELDSNSKSVSTRFGDTFYKKLLTTMGHL